MEQIRAELEAIKASSPGNRLTADAVVAFAQQEDSALHSQFEWDDTIAGHRYRIDQARNLIAKVKIEVRTEFNRIESVYYVRDPNASSKEQGYVSVDDLRSDAELARDALFNEFVAVRALLTRARNLAAILGMGEKVDGLLTEVSTISRALSEHQSVTAS